MSSGRSYAAVLFSEVWSKRTGKSCLPLHHFLLLQIGYLKCVINQEWHFRHSTMDFLRVLAAFFRQLSNCDRL